MRTEGNAARMTHARPRSRRPDPRVPGAGPFLVLALVALVVAGCLGSPVASPSAAASSAPSASAAPSAPGAGASASAAPPSASPSAAAVAGPLTGSWRVRRVLALDDRSALVPGAAFTDEQYTISATCDNEPCPEIVVSSTPAGRSRPITETTLRRDGDRYVSAASEGVDVPCQNGFGDQVPGGAKASSVLSLWLTSVRPAGTAVETQGLVGTLDLALTPTDLGTSAGCTATAAGYELAGKRGAVAVNDGVKPPSEIPAGVETAALPEIDAAIPNATVRYFDVEGTTSAELGESIGRGALKACGAIRYEWIEGDPTPAACTVTHFPDFDSAIDERTSGGSCTIRANPEVSFTVYLPRWSAPSRVPAVLVGWWRDTVEFVRAHEAGHVRISIDHTERLDDQLDGARCDRADEIIQDWAQALSASQESYDRREYQKAWPEPPNGF